MVAKKTHAEKLTELLAHDKEHVAAQAAEDTRALSALFEALSGDNRAHRVAAARALHALAIKAPVTLKPYGAELA
ncbi:MAG TPA: hypothetical protein VFH17_05680, partial [Coriobacteriia bacterium]|nr:hypothetical protein [Coriobacteriia bacterium]